MNPSSSAACNGSAASGRAAAPRSPADTGTSRPRRRPSRLTCVIHADETISIVEGHLRIEVEGGDTYDLTAGGAASFNKGARTRWAVLAPTVEFFVYS